MKKYCGGTQREMARAYNFNCTGMVGTHIKILFAIFGTLCSNLYEKFNTLLKIGFG